VGRRTDYEENALGRGRNIRVKMSHAMDQGRDKVNVEDGPQLHYMEQDPEEQHRASRRETHW
jgi:hypothetical protein